MYSYKFIMEKISNLEEYLAINIFVISKNGCAASAIFSNKAF